MAAVKSPSYALQRVPRAGPCGDVFNTFTVWVYIVDSDDIAVSGGSYHTKTKKDTIPVLMSPFQSFRRRDHPNCVGTFSEKPLAATYPSGLRLCHGDSVRAPTLVYVSTNQITALFALNGVVSDFLDGDVEVDVIDGMYFWSEPYVEPITTEATRMAKRHADMHEDDALVRKRLALVSSN